MITTHLTLIWQATCLRYSLSTAQSLLHITITLNRPSGLENKRMDWHSAVQKQHLLLRIWHLSIGMHEVSPEDIKWSVVCSHAWRVSIPRGLFGGDQGHACIIAHTHSSQLLDPNGECDSSAQCLRKQYAAARLQYFCSL